MTIAEFERLSVCFIQGLNDSMDNKNDCSTRVLDFINCSSVDASEDFTKRFFLRWNGVCKNHSIVLYEFWIIEFRFSNSGSTPEEKIYN